MLFSTLTLALTLSSLASAASLASKCGPSSAKVVCVDKYASVLPYPFHREISNGKDIGLDRFSTTNTTDKSFNENVASADFLIFDRQALSVLGNNPKAEKMFTIPKLVHEGPVYVPGEEKIFFAQPALPGYLKQFVIDLKASPKPTLKEFEADPPVYSPNGGTIHKGVVYWAQSGGNSSLVSSTGKKFEARQGIVSMDPKTLKTTTILNNFYGRTFNQVNDLVLDAKGDIWFTDPQYAFFAGLSDRPLSLPPATYRFRPSTGAVSIVDDTCQQPNGIVLSPDEKTLYIADSGAINGDLSKPAGTGNIFDGRQRGRTIYAFDVLDGRNLINKRPVYTAPEWIPDGVKVAKNGWLVTGAGMGVDVIDPKEGTIVMRIQTDYMVMNIVFAGKDRKELWIVGAGGVTRVKWELEGVALE